MKVVLELPRTAQGTTLRRCVEGLLPALTQREVAARLRHFALWPSCRGFDVVHLLGGVLPRTSVTRVGTLPNPFALVPDDGIALPMRRGLDRRLRLLTRSCARLHAWTDNQREEFLKHHPAVGERVDVVPPGVAPCFLVDDVDAEAATALFGLEQPFFLCVGERTSVKNLSRVVQAFVRGEFAQQHHLVLVGRDSREFDPIRSALRGLGLEERCHTLGVVADQDLAGLYRCAAVLMHPTLQEDVALPVLEALASGTPVVAANRWAAEELAGGHASLCDPLDVDAIVTATERALARAPAQREAARRHAAAFTWERSATALLDVYRRANEMQ